MGARIELGRHVYGAAAFAFGVITLTLHDFNDWLQLHSLWITPGGTILVYLTGAAQIIGGLAIQWHRTARVGAAVLGCTYLFFALRWVPGIVARPLVYDRWGNIFEQLSLVSGAVIVYASALPVSALSARLSRAGCVLFGICVISFTLEQAFYLSGTADLVPKWIPASQMFWAILTTVAFALAAIALLCGYQARLASTLLTVMIALFGFIVWLPLLVSNPHDQSNWGGNAENWAIGGAAWIVADRLRKRSGP
jgi:uncharacterized membrane protein YphA (DoxX/SURF4 family)